MRISKTHQEESQFGLIVSDLSSTMRQAPPQKKPSRPTTHYFMGEQAPAPVGTLLFAQRQTV